MKRTPAQIKAQKKYDKKRSKYPVLSIRLSPDEKQFFNNAFARFKGTRKEILINALIQYKE